MNKKIASNKTKLSSLHKKVDRLNQEIDEVCTELASISLKEIEKRLGESVPPELHSVTLYIGALGYNLENNHVLDLFKRRMEKEARNYMESLVKKGLKSLRKKK